VKISEIRALVNEHKMLTLAERHERIATMRCGNANHQVDSYLLGYSRDTIDATLPVNAARMVVNMLKVLARSYPAAQPSVSSTTCIFKAMLRESHYFLFGTILLIAQGV
jgi:hypothetical protein